MSTSAPPPPPPERRPRSTGANSGVLAEIAAAADPTLQEHADAQRSVGRYEPDFPEDPDRAFVVEAVHEGWLMHYGTPRLFTRMDDDLRLLGGDSLYALGLARLAALGDLEGVAELAELISLCARVAVEGRSEMTTELWGASVALLAGERGGGARAAFARLAPPTSSEASSDETPRRA